MKKAILGFAASAIIVSAAGCVDRPKQDQAKRTQEIVTSTTIPVVVQPAGYQTLTETLGITGQVTTSNDTQIGAKRGGRLTAVYVRDGDSVSTGQLLASLDSGDLMSQYRQALAALSGARSQLSQAITNARVAPTRSASIVASAQAQVRSARSQLQKALKGARDEERVQAEWQVKSAKSNMETAERELERTRKLVEEGAIPRARLDTAQNAYTAALTQYNAALQQQAMTASMTRPEDLQIAREALRQAEEGLRQAKSQQSLDSVTAEQVQTARAQVDVASAQVDIAKQALSDAQIRSPFAGRVSGNPTQPGTVVSPGQPILRLIGSSGLYFEGEVPETSLSKVTLGRPVSVKVDAFPGRLIPGKVVAISPMGQDVGRLFRARVQLAGDLSGVKPGMFANGDVTVRSVLGATVVPVQAIVQRGGKDVVFVVVGDKAKQLAVTVGLRQGELVEVKGLSPDQQVVVRGQQGLADGSTIVTEPKKLAGSTTEEHES